MNINDYPFYQYIQEDKSKYRHAREAGYIDPTDSFLIGDSGGFLLNIDKDIRYINVELLCPAAIEYETKGRYTPFTEDSLPYINFRKQETVRRMVGYKAPCKYNMKTGKVEDLYITGEYYNFLNYGRILKLDLNTVKMSVGGTTGKKAMGFPRFLDSQYWYMLIKQFARDNGFFLINDKTRRGGFSYMDSIDSANIINLNPNKTIIHAAMDNKILIDKGGFTDFTVNQLTFYETDTPFKRGFAKIDKKDFRLGYKNTDGTVASNSWNSGVISVSTYNNPSAAVGKDAAEVKGEELSEFDNFNEFMNVTMPALRTGSVTTGFLNCWGTAGQSSVGWFVFEDNFYHPEGFNFMPFENVWDKNARHETCGFFKPYCWGLEGYIQRDKDSAILNSVDENGNSDIELGLEIATQEREKFKANNSNAKYIGYCGMYANMPAESFNSVSENIFSSELGDALELWEQKLRMNDEYKFYQDGKFKNIDGVVTFVTNESIAKDGGKFNKDYFQYIINVPRHSNEHPHGCVRKWFNPIEKTYLNKAGQLVKGTPPGMYSINYDPVGVNKETKGITLKHSHNCIQCWMNPCPENNYRPKLVCSYFGRPETLEEADKVCYDMAVYYNCVGTTNVEINRGETVTNFKQWKALKYLSKHPVFLWDANIKDKIETSYGYNIGSAQVKLDGLRMLIEMLKTKVGKDEHGEDILVLNLIFDYQTILELKKFNDKGNFDRVSSMIIRGIEWAAKNKFADSKLQTRQKITENVNDIFSRAWY